VVGGIVGDSSHDEVGEHLWVACVDITEVLKLCGTAAVDLEQLRAIPPVDAEHVVRAVVA
jgi:hypothetical protein